MGAFIWFIASIVLACLELAAGELTFLMLALGALATAGVALADVPLWLEVTVFAVASLVSMVTLKPALRKKLRTPSSVELSTQELVGQRGVLESPELVELSGELWSARSFDEQVALEAGDPVIVVACDGTYVFVAKDES